MRTAPGNPRPGPPSSGFTILEIAVAIAVLTVSIGAVTTTLVATSSLNRTTGERAQAVDAAMSVMESIRAEGFASAFAAFNANPADDPGGAGLAPGSAFDVTGLSAQEGDADGRVGSVTFPGNGFLLREDAVDVRLGTPRDLSGDGVIDALDHSGDYQILPVRVRVDWTGKSGNQFVEFVSTVTEL